MLLKGTIEDLNIRLFPSRENFNSLNNNNNKYFPKQYTKINLPHGLTKSDARGQPSSYMWSFKFLDVVCIHQ